MIAANISTQKRKRKRRTDAGSQGLSRYPKEFRCADCGMGIWRNAREAAEWEAPFNLLANLRVGDKCIGCAGGGSLKTMLTLPPEMRGIEPQEPMTAPPEVLAMHEEYMAADEPPRQIAARYGMTYETMYHHFRRYGLDTRSGSQAQKLRREKERQQMSELNGSGMAMISLRFGGEG